MNADLNDLRMLALALPPSEKVTLPEAGEVVSALVALARYGPEVLQAAKDSRLADFLHEHIAADARARGVEEPQRGATVVTPAAPVPPGTPAIDLDALAALIIAKISEAQAKPAAPAADTVTSDTASPTDNTGLGV